MARLRIGISTLGGGEWLGGVNYTTNLIRSAASLPEPKRPELHLVVRHKDFDSISYYESLFPLVQGVHFLVPGAAERELSPFVRQVGSHEELFPALDFLYPVLSDAIPGIPAASWIPDFQHRHLPHFFSSEELANRDRVFNRIAKLARMAVFSSRTAENDFKTFYPTSRARTHVLHFRSFPDPQWYRPTAEKTVARYGLPSEYLMCCNQFWAHKDHTTLFRGLALLAGQGLELPVVCTGHTEDYRNTEYFPRIRALIDELGIGHLVHILGVIPRIDQIQLMRRSLAVIQPSLFEGWSTVVEDARNLGKTLFLSDFPVHVEQAPEHGHYFPRQDHEALARLVAEHRDALIPTDGTEREVAAREEVEKNRLLFGLELCRMVETGRALFPARTSGPA